MRVDAPAKVNLTLRILGKRPDGYHAVESVMQMLTLADTLTFDAADGLEFTCSEPSLAGEENLVLRAARLLQARLPLPRGARIHLEKRIPAQAGLGGGSSDAAITLSALNEFWELRLTPEELAGMAASLGSDVPFFLDGPTATVRGRGEDVTPFFHRTPCYLVLAKPSAGISTAEVYSRLPARALSPNRPLPRRQETPRMLRALARGRIDEIARGLVNDLEGPALAMLPELITLRERMLQQGCLSVLLCGSGSAVFGICPDEATARHAAIDLTNDASWTWAGPWLLPV
ncbi:MAG: 4-(cytidine 5'-diphospho)-2-C-methyl-D-erythritol kinase [Armatimonadota bacterium]